jgi:hypothetical protein
MRLKQDTASKDFITQVEAGYYHYFRRHAVARCSRVRVVFFNDDSEQIGVNGRDARHLAGCLHTLFSARCPRGTR